jgi:hypothetical protein
MVPLDAFATFFFSSQYRIPREIRPTPTSLFSHSSPLLFFMDWIERRRRVRDKIIKNKKEKVKKE